MSKHDREFKVRILIPNGMGDDESREYVERKLYGVIETLGHGLAKIMDEDGERVGSAWWGMSEERERELFEEPANKETPHGTGCECWTCLGS